MLEWFMGGLFVGILVGGFIGVSAMAILIAGDDKDD